MLRRVLTIFACTIFLGLTATPSIAAEPHRWLLVSDVHFNPFADAKIVEKLAAAPVERWRGIFAEVQNQSFSDYGSDTNYPLLESAIDAMKANVSSPNAIVLSGDFLAHNFQTRFAAALPNRPAVDYDAFVDKTEAFIAREFRTAFPQATVFPAIGNNDGYCGDYQSTPGSRFFAHFAQAWGLPSSFATDGSFTGTVAGENLQFIVLNDVYWATGYQNACGDAQADPGGDQLTWLGEQLRALPTGESAVVVGHIPPGVDVYSTLHSKTASVTMMLAERFNDGFISALEDPSNRVVMELSAHEHMNDFRVLSASQPAYTVPVLMLPAISPIFGGNPSFEIATVDPTTPRVLDLLGYVLENLPEVAKSGGPVPSWRREFSFDTAYRAIAVTADTLEALHSRMFSDEHLRREFDRYYGGDSARAAIPDDRWHQYWCANVALTAIAYTACAMPQIQTQLPPQPTAPPAPPTPTPSPTARLLGADRLGPAGEVVRVLLTVGRLDG